MLVGSARVDLVNSIKDSFADVCASSSPRMWLITSPPGWGKTRLVQELYADLAAAQPPASAYWPPAIVDADGGPVGEARKRITPPLMTQSGRRPAIPWLWWGTQAFALGDGSLGRALEQGADQLYSHGEALIRAERSLLGTVRDAFDMTSATVGILALFVAALAAPPVAVPLAVGAGVEMAVSGGSRLRELARRRRLREGGQQVAAAQFEQNLTARLAEQVQQLSKAVPVLLVIDDAHDADQVTLGVLDRLLRQDARIMVVATAWPEVTSRTDDRPLATWLRSVESSAIWQKVERVELDPLDPASLRQIVSSLAPGTAPEVCEAFARRYDNPLSLRYVLELPRVRRRTSPERIEIEPQEVDDLPGTLSGVFDEAWTELPPGVQSALVLAAVSGQRFVPDLVVRTGRQYLGFTADDLEAAARTYRWTRAIDRSLHGFIEQSFYRLAAGRALEFLGEAEERSVRFAVAELATDSDVMESLSYRAGIEVMTCHIGRVEAAELPADSQAVKSAVSLGVARSLRGDIAGATALFDQAALWAADADDRLGVAQARAWLQGLQGDYHGAVAALERALAAEPAAAQSRSALGVRSDQAWWVSHGIDRAKGVEMCRQLLQTCTEALGPDDRLTLTVRKNYVDGLGQTGRAAEARELSEQLIDDLARVRGANNSWTLIERGYHAYWVYELDGPQRAVGLLQDLVPALIAEIGPTMGPTLANRNNLVQWLRESGRWTEAEEACREAVSDLEAFGAPPDHDADSLRFMMADFHYQAGRLDAAIDQMERALESYSGQPTDQNALQTRSNLGFALWSDGRTTEALAVYRELLPDLTRTLPADHPLIAQAVSNINVLMTEQQKPGGKDTA